MKFLKHVFIRYVVLGAVIFGAGGLFLWPQIQANIFGDIAGKVGGKKAKKKVDKATDKVKKTAEKGIKEVEKVGKGALKELSKLGLPTDPKKLILLALSKMPAKEVTKLANKILDVFSGQLKDLSDTTAIVLDPLDELFRPIPPLPSGLPIPIPIVGSIMNILLGLTQSTEINRSQRETFACLKAFHTLTNNKYINAKEMKLIKSFEKSENKKGIVGKKIDLNSIRNIVVSKTKELTNPINQLSLFIQKELSMFTGPLEQIANEFRPITLAAFIPLGPVYNSVLFAFRLKENHELFLSVQETLGNNLNPVVKSKNKLTSLLDLKKNPVTGSVMKLLDTMKAPADQTLEKIDEMFIDPLSEIPWGTHDLVLMILKVMNLAGGVVDAVMGTIIEALVTALTGGAGATVSGPVSSIIKGVINVDALCEFVNQTFTWSYIRYLRNRIDRLNKLAAQARVDRVAFDSKVFKAEVNKILGIIDSKKKKNSKDKKSSKDKSDKKSSKDKNDKKDVKDTKNRQQASPALSSVAGIGQSTAPINAAVVSPQLIPQGQKKSVYTQPVATPASSSVYSQPSQILPAKQYGHFGSTDIHAEEPDFEVPDDKTGVKEIDDALDESFEDSFAL